MPLVHHAHRDLQMKVVYYGPGLGGKTTNLEYIHANTRPDRRGKLLALENEAERTLFFDLLPMELGQFRNYRVKLHLCTVPGQIAYDTTRQLVLRNVDGIVFVVDSQPTRLEANYESIRNLESNLRLQGDDPDRMPLVVQYNKRDLVGVMGVDELREALRVPPGVQEHEASAMTGEGVFDTLKSITREMLKICPDPANMNEGRTASILPGRRPSMFPPKENQILVDLPRPSRVPDLD
jgi:signal recognition particle receptor subunit beta